MLKVIRKNVKLFKKPLVLTKRMKYNILLKAVGDICGKYPDEPALAHLREVYEKVSRM